MKPEAPARWSRARVFLAQGLLGALGLGALVYLGLFAWVVLNARRDTAAQSDAAIVLGAQAYVGGNWNACLVSRVRQGVRLLQTGVVTRLILSGGVDPEDGATEALVMRDIALSLGAARAALIVETRAMSTAENLEFSAQIMTQLGLRRAILVSDPYHLPRAALIARKLRLEVTVSPALDSPCWSPLGRNVLREPLALLENLWRGSL